MQKIELHKVCKIGNGFAFKSEDYLETGIPLLRISNINNGIVNFKDDTICVAENYLETKKDFIVEKGDVVIALSGATTGKYGIYISNEPALLNQRIGIIKSNVSKKLDSKYFYFYLNILKDEILRKAGGAAQPNISTKEIGNLQIPLPNLPTQQKIAAILDKVDELRQYNKQLIEKYDALTQSLFLEMFGDPVSNEKGWKAKCLGDMIDFLTSGSRGWARYYANVGDVFLRIQNVGYNKLKLDDLTYIKTPETAEAKRTKVQAGDIIISITADLGRTGVIPENFPKAFINQHLAILRLKENFNPNYVSAFIASKGGQALFHKLDKGGVKSGLNFTDLKSYNILCPPLSLQNQFAERIQLIETQKQQVQEALAKSEDLFQGLLQQAFNGELT